MFFPLPKNESARPKRAFPLNQYLPLNDRCFCEHFLIILSFMNVSPWKPFKHVIPPHPGALSRPPHTSPEHKKRTSWKKLVTQNISSSQLSFFMVFSFSGMIPYQKNVTIFADPKDYLKFQNANHLGFCSSIPFKSIRSSCQKKNNNTNAFSTGRQRGSCSDHSPGTSNWSQSPDALLKTTRVVLLSRKVMPSATKDASPPMKQHREFHWICGWHCGGDSSQQDAGSWPAGLWLWHIFFIVFILLHTHHFTKRKTCLKKQRFSQKIIPKNIPNNPVLPFKKTCLADSWRIPLLLGKKISQGAIALSPVSGANPPDPWNRTLPRICRRHPTWKKTRWIKPVTFLFEFSTENSWWLELFNEWECNWTWRDCFFVKAG